MTLFFIIYQTIHVEFFLFFLLVLVDSALLTAHSQKTVDFNQCVCVCVGVENSFALVPCFPRDSNALQSSGFECLFSKLFGVFASFILCSFLPQLCFASGSRRLQSVCHIFPRGQSAFPCFYLLLLSFLLYFFGAKILPNKLSKKPGATAKEHTPITESERVE